MVGLALEGGGAKGAFHMGAVKALIEEGYCIEGIAGTSIGALNGAIIAQGDFKAGYHMWEAMDNSLLFEMEDMPLKKILNQKIDRAALVHFTTKIKNVIENKGLDTSKIRALLDSMINERKLRESSVDFGLVTVSLSDFKPLELYKEDIPQGKIIDYLMASANYPLFKIEPIDGKFFIDGGFYDNCPINLLIRKGYREIIAIRTFAIGIVRKVEDDSVKVLNIVPSDDLGSVLNFDHELIQHNLKLGYFDAMRAIRHLKGKKYCIQPVNDDLILKGLLSIPDELIESIGKKMELSPMDPKRMLFEKIIPRLSRMLGIPPEMSYQDAIIGILEYIAEERGLDRFKIRSLSEFLEEIKSIRTQGPANTPALAIPGILRKTMLNTVFSKDLILKSISQDLLDTLELIL